jgi:mandelamide amidase
MKNKSTAAIGLPLLFSMLSTIQTVYAGQSSIDFDNLTAVQAAADFCAGKVSSEMMVTEALSKAKARAELNAFITLDEDGSLAAARKADSERNNDSRCKPLAGVPIVIKDNIEVAGLPNTAGTKALSKYIAKKDAPVVSKLRAAGAIIIGKTNMHELAFGTSGFNPSVPTKFETGVRNAYDSTKIAGGSSSGTAAAVAARIAPAGLGSDTGGSVRIPCALNGCASLRPTLGRYSQAGIVPISRTRDTAGPMAVSMADVELLDRVITGDAVTQAADLKKLRIGVYAPMLANLDEDTKVAVDVALEKMKGAGVTVVEIDMPGITELNNQIGFPVLFYEAYDDLAAYLKQSGLGITIANLAQEISSPDVKNSFDRFVMPRKIAGPENTLFDTKPIYDSAIKKSRPALIKLYQSTFSKYKIDAIAFPTTTKVAINAGPESSNVDDTMAYIRNTDPGSNAGIPGLQLSIALGATSKLPVGLELDGPAGSDRKLIGIGLALEQLFGRLPPPSKR